jgi:hypothetical protein
MASGQFRPVGASRYGTPAIVLPTREARAFQEVTGDVGSPRLDCGYENSPLKKNGFCFDFLKASNQAITQKTPPSFIV